jgi:N-methylhydantoinase B
LPLAPDRSPGYLFTEVSRQFVSLGAIPEDAARLSAQGESVDPVTFAVIGGALFSICKEMDLTLRNTSLSPIINIGKDFSCALLTSDCQLVAQASNCPGHVGSIHYAVRACVDAFGDELADGDVYILNDPYYGGTHLPDITLISPVFHEDELVLFACNRAHHSDVGGSVPGSFPLSSEIFEEGFRIPPTRFVERGRLNRVVLDLLLANVRTPDQVEGDLEAQLAANHAGAAGVARLIDKYGRNVVVATMLEYLDHSERALRAALELPSGSYEAEDWIDGDGTSDERRRIRVCVTVTDDRELLVDFTGTDAQVRAPVNSVFPTTASMVVTALLALVDPTIMPNHGFYRPISVRAPLGTMVNPLFPTPAVGFPDVCNRIVDVIMEALTPVMPERVIASTSGTTTNVFFGGHDPRRQIPYVWYSINSQGGWGGRSTADGWHNVCFVEANGWDIPVETIEYRYPWRVVAYRLRDDDTGAGKFRGGKGNHLALTPLDHDVVFSMNGDRAVTPPHGVFGGKPGATASCRIERADGTVERIAPATMKV